MKSMKGRFLKTLKFIPAIHSLKQGRVVSHLNYPEKFSHQNLQFPTVCTQENQKQCNLSQDEEILEVGLNDNEEHHSLSDFKAKCPPGGSEAIILYTTSLRSIRKTFEDCQTVRFLLESFKVKFQERDVSMHLEFREELWRIEGGRVIPPRLFIRGRYIGGADEVVGLHEQGKLRKLLEGIPRCLSTCPCTGCGNLRFLVCSNCHGSKKVVSDEGKDEVVMIRCPECNENGLVTCPICS